MHSAFDYAGQKCSAASRVLVHESIHDGLLERLAGAVEVLEVGPAERMSIDVPAVIVGTLTPGGTRQVVGDVPGLREAALANHTAHVRVAIPND